MHYFMFIIILVIAIAVLYVGSYAKYQYIENVELVKGDINYKPYDYRIAYINVNSVVHTCPIPLNHLIITSSNLQTTTNSDKYIYIYSSLK